MIDLVKVGLNPEQASDLTLKCRLNIKKKKKEELKLG
jgi:hypothetical protein